MSNELFGEVVKTISLDFAQKTSPVTVFAKQGDNRTRIIHIQPLMNGVPMNIDTSFQYVAKFAAKKPDGHYVYNDSAKINDDGTITVTLTDQTLAAHGNAICCIVLETQSGDVLSSQNFTLIVEFSAGAYQNLASSDEIMGLDDKLAQVQELIDKLGEEIQRIPPINPEDKDKVLTANEDGTAGWKDPKGGLSVTEITSPEEITADSPDGLYIQEGGSSGGNGGTTIHYYNGLGEVPADLPEGSFVAVPSPNNVIDLTKYMAAEGVTFNDKLFQMFAASENYANLDDDGTFWVDFEKCQNPVIVIDMSSMVEGQQVYCNPSLVIKKDGLITDVSIAFNVKYDSSTNMKVTLEIGNAPRNNPNEHNFSTMRLITEVV